MAITTLDGAIAGMQPVQFVSKGVTATLVAGRPHSLWYQPGAPGVGAAVSTTTAGGVALSSTSAMISGQLPHIDPGSGNAYLARLTGTATQAGMLLLCDRLLHCGANSGGTALSNTLTTAQLTSTTTLPARDANGQTAGVGVQCAIEIATTVGAGAPTITYSYLDETGTATSNQGSIDAVVASSVSGAFYRMALGPGDLGVRSVTSIQIASSMTSGSIAIVLYRVLAALELPGALIPNAIDALTAGFPRIFNGCVPFLVFIPNTTTASIVTGTYCETQG